MTLNKTFRNLAFGIAALAFTFTACNNHNKKPQELQQEVIAIHDTVMAEMSTLMERKITINHIISRLDSLKSTNSEIDTAKTRTVLTQIKTELATADDEMMTWMHNFNPNHDDKSDDEIIAYLNGQKEKIILVNRSIKNAILKSDSVIAVYK